MMVAAAGPAMYVPQSITRRPERILDCFIQAAPLVRKSLLQILIEPFNRVLDRLFALFAVDAVVRDLWDRDVFLLRAGHAVVGELGMIFIVKQLFLLGHDKEDRRVFDLPGLLDGRVSQQSLAV